MAALTINDKEYNIDDMNEEQQELVKILQQNAIVTNQLDHQLQCVRAVGKVKADELSNLLDADEKKV